jgi:hypothetical protein
VAGTTVSVGRTAWCTWQAPMSSNFSLGLLLLIWACGLLATEAARAATWDMAVLLQCAGAACMAGAGRAEGLHKLRCDEHSSQGRHGPSPTPPRQSLHSQWGCQPYSGGLFIAAASQREPIESTLGWASLLPEQG